PRADLMPCGPTGLEADALLADEQFCSRLLVEGDPEAGPVGERERAVFGPRGVREELPEELVAGVRLDVREVLDDRADARRPAEDHVQVVRLVRVRDDRKA